MFRGWIVAALFALNLTHSDYFAPSHRLAGIGLARSEITPEVLAARTDRMIQSQTFAIMRESVALAGAERITSPRLQQIFKKASLETGVPAPLIAAIAYLESWGDSRAESPAGPKGIMQFAEATGRAAGLRIVYATRYKVVRSRQPVKASKGRSTYRTVARRTPYSVKVRDDRFVPDRAVIAAARYLARLRDKFGGQDWAVFAYHCGEGCVTEMLSLTQDALGHKQTPTVADMFFAASPAHHRELYEAIERHMQRDYSPTYWFRVKRAEQLLALYQSDPAAFRKLIAEYRNSINPARRANDRLAVWLKTDDLLYQSCDDLRRAQGKDLVPVLEDPRFFGFSVNNLDLLSIPTANIADRDLYKQASPAAIGTLAYIAFETRRLFDAAKPKGERWAPFEVAELVSTKDGPQEAGGRGRSPDFPAHCTGQVFDIDISGMPRGEREALSFVLDEMGWDGYLGFIQVTGDTLHIGCSPSSREFFAQVFQEAVAASR
jgi:hypothetical protein